MDTLFTHVKIFLETSIFGKIQIIHLLSVFGGVLIPILFGLILPRKRTVQYGILINRILGLALLQKRVFKNFDLPDNIIEAIALAVQTTFQDISFGVYIDSRKDLTPEDKQKKIKEYLTPEKSTKE